MISHGSDVCLQLRCFLLPEILPGIVGGTGIERNAQGQADQKKAAVAHGKARRQGRTPSFT